MIGWRRARRRAPGRPNGVDETPTALDAPEPAAPEPAEQAALDARDPAALETVDGVVHEPREPELDPVPAPGEAAPSDVHLPPGGAAGLGATLPVPSVEEIREPAEPASPAVSPSPGTSFTEAARGSAAAPHPTPALDVPGPVPTAAVAAQGPEIGGRPDGPALEPTDHTHWALVGAVMLVTAAAVATLLLLAGHVL